MKITYSDLRVTNKLEQVTSSKKLKKRIEIVIKLCNFFYKGKYDDNELGKLRKPKLSKELLFFQKDVISL